MRVWAAPGPPLSFSVTLLLIQKFTASPRVLLSWSVGLAPAQPPKPEMQPKAPDPRTRRATRPIALQRRVPPERSSSRATDAHHQTSANLIGDRPKRGHDRSRTPG